MVWQTVVTGVLIEGSISGEIYQTLTFGILGGYFASNVMSKKIDKE